MRRDFLYQKEHPLPNLFIDNLYRAETFSCPQGLRFAAYGRADSFFLSREKEASTSTTVFS